MTMAGTGLAGCGIFSNGNKMRIYVSAC
jgi:hypothetical protein